MNSEPDRVLHQPIRTRIVALLVSEGAVEYSRIKSTLELSDGHMSTHMKELVGSGYVDLKKDFVANKPRITYTLTREGKKKFSEYVKQLKALLS